MNECEWKNGLKRAKGKGREKLGQFWYFVGFFIQHAGIHDPSLGQMTDNPLHKTDLGRVEPLLDIQGVVVVLGEDNGLAQGIVPIQIINADEKTVLFCLSSRHTGKRFYVKRFFPVRWDW